MSKKKGCYIHILYEFNISNILCVYHIFCWANMCIWYVWYTHDIPLLNPSYPQYMQSILCVHEMFYIHMTYPFYTNYIHITSSLYFWHMPSAGTWVRRLTSRDSLKEAHLSWLCLHCPYHTDRVYVRVYYHTNRDGQCRHSHNRWVSRDSPKRRTKETHQRDSPVMTVSTLPSESLYPSAL